jgi:hypothetical protein
VTTIPLLYLSSDFIYFYPTAVVAKAPRKNVAPGRSSVVSPNGGASGKRKGKMGGGGNPLKLWPVPKGQKGLLSFCGSHGDAGGGCSTSMEPCSSTEQLEELTQEQLGQEYEEAGGEGSSSSCENNGEGSGSPYEERSDSGSDDLPTGSINLPDDITQLNSDSEED